MNKLLNPRNLGTAEEELEYQLAKSLIKKLESKIQNKKLVQIGGSIYIK